MTPNDILDMLLKPYTERIEALEKRIGQLEDINSDRLTEIVGDEIDRYDFSTNRDFRSEVERIIRDEDEGESFEKRVQEVVKEMCFGVTVDTY